MKLVYWILIILGLVAFPLIIMLTLVLTLEISWWWLIGVIISEIVIGIAIGVIILIIKLRKKKPMEIKIGAKEAKARAIKEKKYDEDDPDNFKIENTVLLRVGLIGKEPTPLLWLHGKGTELNKTIDALINLNTPEQETSWLSDKTEEKVMEIAKLMAQYPAQEIKEERIISTDEFGRPTTTIKSSKMSQAEVKEEQQKQEAEEKNAI